MSWKEHINPETTVWRGVEEYARERIETLTAVCVAASSSDMEIRQAQAAMAEVNRLLSLPQALHAEAQIRAAKGARKEY